MRCPPLAGRRILVTRASQQYPATAALIQAREGIPLSLPCLAIEPLPMNMPSLWQASRWSDVLFTSVNGVEAVAKACGDGFSAYLKNYRIAAVGKKTSQALQQHRIQVDIMPKTSSQEGVFEAYQQHGLPSSLLFFRAEKGSEFLSEHLRAQEVDVHTALAYRAICPQDDCSDIKKRLANKQIDAVILASARTAHHYLQRITEVEIANNTNIIVISQQVADAADKLGLKVQLIAKQTSFTSILDDLETYFSS